MFRMSRRLSGYSSAALALTGVLIALIVAAQGVGVARAAAVLSLDPITWSAVGLDEADVNRGPNEYPVGVRVCNTGDAVTPSGLTATFAFTSPGAAISLASSSPTQTFPVLDAGRCQDIYYWVRVTRATASLDQTRSFNITVTDGSSTVSVAETLVVQRLEAIDNNSTVVIDGPAAVTVGNAATYTVEASAGTTGYAELQHFLTLCADLFRIDSVEADYEFGGDADGSTQLWVDGCVWDLAGTSGCTSTAESAGGETTYSINVTALAAGQCTLRSMVYGYDEDADGFFYNNDFGQDSLAVNIASSGESGAAQATPTSQPGITPTATATTGAPTAGPSPTATRTPTVGPERTPTPDRTATAQRGTGGPVLPQTGYRARPGTLTFADRVGPALSSSQQAFTVIVIATLLLGIILVLWSILLVAGLLSRDSALVFGVWRVLSALFVVSALGLIGLLGYNVLMSQRAAPPAASEPAYRPVELYEPAEIPATRLIIPELDIDTSLTEAPMLAESWDVSGFFKEIAHLEGTAYPGTSGNAVLAGHVRTTDGIGPFYFLRDLQPGNMIIARGDGIEYRYQVEWVKIVEPDDDTVLAASTEPVLTLVSCTNWDSASWSYLDRLVVRAKFFDRAIISAEADS